MGKIYIGFNCNCFTNRFDEPEVWAGICKDIGVSQVMFNIDLIDPNWPWDLQRRLADETLDACAKNGVNIFAAFGGHHGHQHYLGHPDAGVRKEAVAFYKRAVRLTAYLGGRSFGTCFAILTDRCNRDPLLRKTVIDAAVAGYSEVAEYAHQVGLSALAYEMTSVERETCATFAENDEILERCASFAVPMRICLDLGHRNMHGLPEETDHLAWINRYVDRCDVIDCQQTDMNASHHWPFTPEYNKKGVIRGEEIVQAIKTVNPQHDILLALELRTSAYYPQENTHLDSLCQSVEYWKKFLDN